MPLLNRGAIQPVGPAAASMPPRSRDAPVVSFSPGLEVVDRLDQLDHVHRPRDALQNERRVLVGFGGLVQGRLGLGPGEAAPGRPAC